MAVCLSGLPTPKAFDCIGEPATLEQRWTIWKFEFELYCTASGIKDSKQQRAILLHLAGAGIREIFHAFTAEQQGEDYKTAMDSLTQHFKLKKNVPMARQAFLTAVPKPGERIHQFAIRLQTLCEHCEYNDQKDSQIRDRILTFILDKPLKAKLFREEGLTLSKLLEIVNTYHDKEALVLVPDQGGVNQLRVQQKPDSAGPKFDGRCHRCNKQGHKAADCRCSKNHQCEKCGKIGHFKVCCKSKQTSGKAKSASGPKSKGRKPSHVRQLEAVDVQETDSEEEEDVFNVFCTHTESPPGTMEISIGGVIQNVIIDSGASCNLMSERTFNDLSKGDIVLKPSSKQIFAYSSSDALNLKGSCMLNVQVPETNVDKRAKFFIVSGKASTLLGRELSEALGILKVGVQVNSCSSDFSAINTQLNSKAALKAKFPNVFHGLGKLKGFKLKLHIDQNIKPVAQPLRRIPFSRRQKVADKLEELEKLGVVEKVNSPTSWINPLGAVEKPNGDVRICLDMRQANQAILRERHPVPTMQETLQEISDAKIFTKLDLNMAFHQIELSPESRDITTFAAPTGLYRYCRLLFGVNMATEKFQNLIWQVLKDCPGAFNMHDDILIVGRNQKEHDENLERAVQKLQDSGLTLNYEKCVVGASSMDFMGDTISADGLKLSDKRVEAIVEAPAPTNQSEVRSFLGSAQFCAKFIPQFATISAPLWDLTSKNAKWKWGAKEAESFAQIKHLLTCAPVMSYFTQGAQTRIITDASPVGLGAILEQRQPGDGQFRPVYYASRKLSKVEQRYSQFEREALAVKWACEKFHMFLYGTHFEILTDHKPLISVLGPKSKPPSARIERWLLYLQQFSYVVRHISGKENSADALSRLPVGPVQTADSKATSEYVFSTAKAAVPVAMTPKHVEVVSEKDPTLILVREAIRSGDFTRLTGTLYKAVSKELWIAGQLVMRGNRIVLPESLWKQAIILAHEGHQGMVRTKSRLRSKLWWPQMDAQAEQFIKACYPCQLVGPRGKPEPVRSTELPEEPWEDLATDLTEIPGGNHLLVVVDNYSRWPEVVLLKKTDAPHVITALEGIFRTHGIPYTVRSDNGPPFASKEFENFLEFLGIEHKKGIPYWPQSNGEVERCNRTILKVIRIANLQGNDWKKALDDFLFQYRTTNHAATGCSPAELLMGRQLRDKLPSVKIPKDRATESEWQHKLRDRDALSKLRQKEYADARRHAEPSGIDEGDEVLLRQTRRENKLSPVFEPEAYKVLQKTGNAVVLEDSDGNRKMRNVAQMKKFIKPQEAVAADMLPTPPEIAQEHQTAPETQNQSTLDCTAEMPASPGSLANQRPARTRQQPVRFKDYVLQ
ncbi:uncharacterized protein LOC116613084 isoform X1 [Nematostella vectensis]|uniref:uncharacterized protein LOC116613084 isoform X1 n=1 Tax=Nematostella vectensis TaxID=45351 RepID=UPI00207791CA|nr:uncharacterized protein LOC116613084 isoform X1 [Nematostella vectensis]